jgi:hypothetical protein
LFSGYHFILNGRPTNNPNCLRPFFAQAGRQLAALHDFPPIIQAVVDNAPKSQGDFTPDASDIAGLMMTAILRVSQKKILKKQILKGIKFNVDVVGYLPAGDEDGDNLG